MSKQILHNKLTITLNINGSIIYTNQFKSKLNETTETIIKSLENNQHLEIVELNKLIFSVFEAHSIMIASMQDQLDETLQDNQELLSVVRFKHDDNIRCSDHSGLGNNLRSSFSTTSLVHLQYKYEELLSTYKGLLKLLDMRNNDLKKYKDENLMLQEKLQNLNDDLINSKEQITKLKLKLEDLKCRKNNKLMKLRNERQTLAAIHNHLIAFLHRQCMERNSKITSLLKSVENGDNGLLLEEIRKTNILTYENFQLRQELDYLRSCLRITVANGTHGYHINRNSQMKLTSITN